MGVIQEFCREDCMRDIRVYNRESTARENQVEKKTDTSITHLQT